MDSNKMLPLLKELFFLLTADQRKRFYKIQILVLFMAFAEVLGIASIGPFMALVGDVSLLEKNQIFIKLFQMSGLHNKFDFIFAFGVVVLAFLAFASITSLIATWRLSLFAFKIGTEIADRLYTHYMTQNWLFHSKVSSAHLIKQVSTESFRITAQVILPLMQMNARIVLALFISLGMLIYNPFISIIGVVCFLGAYFLLFKVVKLSLARNGVAISEMSSKRFRLMNEGFGGIKDILLLGRNNFFINNFHESGSVLARASGINNALAYAPRYLMELLAFGVMITLILFLIHNDRGNLGAVLPTLAVYGLAGFKLLPALQHVYASISEIKGNIAAFEAIKDDLADSKSENLDENKTTDRLSLKDHIVLKDINFRYPDKAKNALSNLNLTIPANQFVGFVGSSGAGKSTVIDILLGLIKPDSGELIVNGNKITSENLRSWQNAIGFVPQSIFLSEGSIAENIAFGISEGQIDSQQIERVVKLARLEEFVNQLPLGINTKVGERGVQLSGGQRQRIGIARALYSEADVLVFDEATSALDGITEKLIMDAIQDFAGKKTIIMIAHRLKTVEKCDRIFFLENGCLKSEGSYKDLIEHDDAFKKMAAHA